MKTKQKQLKLQDKAKGNKPKRACPPTEEEINRDKQRSTKHTHKIKDRVTRTPLKTGGELRCSGRVSSSCSTSGTHRVNLVTPPVICRVKIFTHMWKTHA